MWKYEAVRVCCGNWFERVSFFLPSMYVYVLQRLKRNRSRSHAAPVCSWSWTGLRRRQKPTCVQFDDVLPRFCLVDLCLFATFGFHRNWSGLIIISTNGLRHRSPAGHAIVFAVRQLPRYWISSFFAFLSNWFMFVFAGINRRATAWWMNAVQV